MLLLFTWRVYKMNSLLGASMMSVLATDAFVICVRDILVFYNILAGGLIKNVHSEISSLNLPMITDL